MGKKAIGIDIGGTGIKGALVDVKKGVIIGERIRRETPDGARPAEIAAVVAELVSKLSPSSRTLPVGICFPAVVIDGVTKSAANVSDDWIDLNAKALFEKELNCPVTIINDADAAGVAEMKFGAGKRKRGVVFMATLGTGIGTAIFTNGKLVPNAELGHLEIEGVDYETKASFAAKERENLDWDTWVQRLQTYFSTVERLLSPKLIIVGGGVSREHKKFLPKLTLSAVVTPAKLFNNAGILGAAWLAERED